MQEENEDKQPPGNTSKNSPDSFGGPNKGEDPDKSRLDRLSSWARQDVWNVELGGVPTFKRLWTKTVRVILIACRGFVRDQVTRHAMALTYITIFALPPFLAFVFSIAKGVGVYKDLKEGPINSFLNSNFGGDEAGQVRQAIDQIFSYVENTPLGSVAAIGLLVILFAVLKLLGAVEFTLNDIWGVRRSRPLVRKVTDYLAIVTVTPVLLVAGAGLSAFLNERVVDLFDHQGSTPAVATAEPGVVGDSSIETNTDGLVLEEPSALSVPVESTSVTGDLRPASDPTKAAILRVISTLSIVLGMAFVIFTLPNTKVRLGAALLGGLLAGSLWQMLQLGSVQVQFWLVGKSAVYSSLAAIPMLMIWIYLSWIILLIGAELACAFQTEPVVASLARTGAVDQRLREIVAPRLAVRITAAFLKGQKAPSTEQMASDLGLAPRVVVQVLERLVQSGLLVRTGEEDDEGYLPGRDPGTIHLQELLLALRQGPGSRCPVAINALDQAADQARIALLEESAHSGTNRTLREIAGF